MAEEEGEEEGKEEGEEVEGEEEGEEEAPADAPPLAPPAGWVKVFHARRQRHVYVNEETGEMARYITIIYYIRHVYVHEETGEMASAPPSGEACADRRARRCRGGPPRRVKSRGTDLGDTGRYEIRADMRTDTRADTGRCGEIRGEATGRPFGALGVQLVASGR